MEEIDKKLLEKFDDLMSDQLTEEEATEFLSNLSTKEYERLIYLFENNKIDGMSKNMRLELVKVFKKVKEGLLKNQ
ncbi:hypothetical protein KAS31_00130 [Candidatus Parcubacteria bacterium]|nr:hypothetical protein [Candidatus Parcubacteria bacterium]